MATTGVMNGTKLRLYVDTSGGSTYTAVGTSMDVTFTASHSPRETTNQDSGGNASFLEGKRSYSASFNALHAEDSANNFWDWFAQLEGSGRGDVACKIATATSGDTTQVFDGWITSLVLTSGGPEGNATFSGEVQFTGSGTTGTVA